MKVEKQKRKTRKMENRKGGIKQITHNSRLATLKVGLRDQTGDGCSPTNNIGLRVVHREP
jgi:hypothetical protein